MDETQLLKILKEEDQDAADYYSSELADDQATSMDRFFGKTYGDEVEGRSQVTTHDIEDCINWMMPDLMRTFMASDELVTLEPGSKEDEAPYNGEEGARSVVECAADYLDHVFFKDNEGATNLYDFAFDGLLQRRGVMRVAWEDPQPKPAKMLEGIAPDKLAKYTNDPEYEILEQDEDRQTGFYSLKVQHSPRMGRMCIEAVAPENFRISRRAKSIPVADYHSEITDEFLGNVIRDFPKKARDLNPEAATTSYEDEETDKETDPRYQARWEDEAVDFARSAADHAGRRKVRLHREYMRIDYDGDGVVELRAIKRVGDIILENIEVDKSEYVSWTPLRVSHKSAGRSIADVLMPIQRVRTVVLRKVLDGLSQALTPRTAVNTQIVGAEGIDDLLDNDIGGHVRCSGDVRAAIQTMTTPDVSGSGYQMLEYMDQRAEEASGQTRHSQGLDPTALNKTATGIDLLQAAAKARTELIARWLGKGLEEVFQRMLELLCAHQDGAREVKIKGEWIAIDPRRWSDEMAVRVHVGMASSSRAQQIGNLDRILANQEKILLQAGPGNPIVTPIELRNTLAEQAQAMGYKDATRFYREIPKDYEPPQAQAQQDPKVIEAQAKVQLQEQAAQHDAQLREKETAHKRQVAEFEAETQRQIAVMKTQSEAAIAEMRARAEAALAEQRLAFEQDLAEREFAFNSDLARRKQDDEIDIKKASVAAQAKTKANGKVGVKKNRPGGDLDK